MNVRAFLRAIVRWLRSAAILLVPLTAALTAFGLFVHASTRLSSDCWRSDAAAQFDRRVMSAHWHAEAVLRGDRAASARLRSDILLAERALNTLDSLEALVRPGARQGSGELDRALRESHDRWSEVRRHYEALVALEGPGRAAATDLLAEADKASRAVTETADRLAEGAFEYEERERTTHLFQLALMIALLVAVLALAAALLARMVHAERRQRGELQRLAWMAQHTLNGVALADADGHLYWVNDAFTHLTGWTIEDVRGWPVAALLEGAPAGAGPAAELDRAMVKRSEFRSEVRCAARGGFAFWADLQCIPVEAGHGSKAQMLVVMQDTEERHAATAALFESEARFRSTLNSLTEGIIVHGPDGAIRLSNPAAERILELTHEQLSGRVSMDPRWRAIREDGSDFPGTEHPAMVTLRTGQGVSGAVMGLNRPSGRLAWISIETSPIPGPDGGELAGVVASFTDVTERLKAEAEIRKLQRVVEQSPVLCLITDAERRIEYVNPSFERTTGWSLADLRGENPRVFSAGTTSPDTYLSLWTTLDAGHTWHGELMNRRKDGTSYPARSSVFPLRDARGNVSHYVAISEDVTAEHEKETQLARANEAALSAARARSEFLQNMSHELRTPMNGILGMANLLLDTELSAAQRSDLLTLRSSADQLLTVISQLFDFARTDGAVEGEGRVPFRLRGCLRELQGRFATAAEARGLSWRVNIPDDVPDALEGDPGALRQVLQHLADNAVKFTERGRVELCVTAEAVTAGSARLRFEVSDSGIGIEPERQAAIFEAFGQADSSSTRRYGGLGLGLTLAQRIVQRMHGQLAVRSLPGEGSTFSFVIELPLAHPCAEDAPAAVWPQGTHLLLVDGGASARTHARESLERLGAIVVVVPGVEGAAANLRETLGGPNAPRALLLDQRSGGFDAFAAARRLREAFGTALPPLVLLTAAGRRGDAERCAELGIGAYLTQPVGDTDLEAALERLLREHAPEARPALVTRHFLRESRRPLRLLLVEDNAVNRKVATRLLERSGFEVGVAVNGRDGVEKFCAGAWDAVLMDIQMPVMDGLEATREVRAWEQQMGAKRTPIIAVTAHTLDADRLAVAEAGMDGFVAKPIQADELFRVIRSLVGDAAGEADHDAAPAALREVLDWDEALRRMDGDEVVLREILRLFQQDSASMMERLDEARASGDARQLERAAHGLKGASATISARAVAALAREVESFAREGEMTTALDRLGDLRVELMRLSRALEALPEPRRDAA